MAWAIRYLASLLCAIAAPNAAIAEQNKVSYEAAAQEYASKLLEWTRTSQRSYAVVSRSKRDADDGYPADSLMGQYRSGVRHRVETLVDRVIANCADKTGHHFKLTTGKISTDAKLSRQACGIYATGAAETAKYHGKKQYKFGEAQRISIKSGGFVRTYDIMPSSGAIIFSQWQTDDAEKRIIFTSEALEYSEAELDPAMFTRKSLQKRFLPEKYSE